MQPRHGIIGVSGLIDTPFDGGEALIIGRIGVSHDGGDVVLMGKLDEGVCLWFFGRKCEHSDGSSRKILCKFFHIGRTDKGRGLCARVLLADVGTFDMDTQHCRSRFRCG